MKAKAFSVLLFVVVIISFGSLNCIYGNAHSTSIDEKRKLLALRKIGHEILLASGDSTSRVLPIKHIEGVYTINFDTAFGFEPALFAHIASNILGTSYLAESYIVEILSCEAQEVVHSFEIISGYQSEQIPCTGRFTPKACYEIALTFNGKTIVKPEGIFSPTQLKNGSLIVILSVVVIAMFLFTTYKIFFSDPIKEVNNDHYIKIGNISLDSKKMLLINEEQSISISNKEMDLLILLNNSLNQPVSREEILKEVWNDEGEYIGRTLDVYISKLRKKLRLVSGLQVINIRGFGYKLIDVN